MKKLAVLTAFLLSTSAFASDVDLNSQIMTCSKYNSLVNHLSSQGVISADKAEELKACLPKKKTTEQILEDYYVNFVTTENSRVLPFFTNFNDPTDNLYLGSDIPMAELAGYRLITHRDIKANIGYQYSESTLDITAHTQLDELQIFAKTDKVVNRAIKLIAPNGSLVGGRTTYAHYDIPAANDWFISQGVITATANKPADYAY